MTHLLIVTADDAGLHRGMTEGAIRAHRQGIVTACSVVANGAAFEDAVDRLRDTPSLEVGVHLTLVEERPLTPMRFPRRYTSFVPLYLARVISMAAIERELRAQIERVLATGLTVTHLNGHQHLHLLPRIFALVRRLAGEYLIDYVRIVNEGTPASRRLIGRRLAARGGGRDAHRSAGEDAGVPRRLSIAVLNFLGRRARKPGLTNDHTIGVAGAGHLTDVVPLLDSVRDVTELVTHPGTGVSDYDWGYDWEAEMHALCDPRLRDELAQRDIRLIAPSHL